MARPRRHLWSDGERGLLVDLRGQNPKPSWASITRYFPGRTKEALQTQMNLINKRKKREQLKATKGRQELLNTQERAGGYIVKGKNNDEKIVENTEDDTCTEYINDDEHAELLQTYTARSTRDPNRFTDVSTSQSTQPRVNGALLSSTSSLSPALAPATQYLSLLSPSLPTHSSPQTQNHRNHTPTMLPFHTPGGGSSPGTADFDTPNRPGTLFTGPAPRPSIKTARPCTSPGNFKDDSAQTVPDIPMQTKIARETTAMMRKEFLPILKRLQSQTDDNSRRLTAVEGNVQTQTRGLESVNDRLDAFALRLGVVEGESRKNRKMAKKAKKARKVMKRHYPREF
ncbi:hypothetical protein BDV12DRAFT_201515 [Aspergillus spectabilis]